jgi:hypothetical protein
MNALYMATYGLRRYESDDPRERKAVCASDEKHTAYPMSASTDRTCIAFTRWSDISTNAASTRASPSARHDTRIGVVVLTPRRGPFFFFFSHCASSHFPTVSASLSKGEALYVRRRRLRLLRLGYSFPRPGCSSRRRPGTRRRRARRGRGRGRALRTPSRRVGTDRRVDRTRVHEKNSRAPEKGLPPSFLFSMSPRRSGASRLSETATLFGKTSHARFDRWKYFFRFSHVILRKRLVSEQPRIPQTRPRVARST